MGREGGVREGKKRYIIWLQKVPQGQGQGFQGQTRTTSRPRPRQFKAEATEFCPQGPHP